MTKKQEGIAYKICPICGDKHSNTSLLQSEVEYALKEVEHIDYALCLTHAELKQDYLAFVAIEGTPLHFTGESAHILWHVAERFFDNVATEQNKQLGFVFCVPDVIRAFEILQNKEHKLS